MYVHEEVLHYVARFLEHYDITNSSHREAVKELRSISNQLLEALKAPRQINVIRHVVKKDLE